MFSWDEFSFRQLSCLSLSFELFMLDDSRCVCVCVYVCAKDLLTYPHEPLEFAHTLAFFNIKNVGWALHLSPCVCHKPHSSIQQSLMRMWRALVPNEHGTLSPKKDELRAKESGKRATLSYLRVDKRHWSKLQVLWMKTTAPLWNALFQKLHADNPSTCFNRLYRYVVAYTPSLFNSPSTIHYLCAKILSLIHCTLFVNNSIELNEDDVNIIRCSAR